MRNEVRGAVRASTRKLLIVRVLRILVQLGALLLFGKWTLIGLVYCPFAIPFVSCRSCPVLECPGRWLQPFAGWAILGTGALGGRIFCGWLCPVGLAGDVMRKLPQLDLLKTAKRRFASRALSLLKFSALAFALLLIFALDNPRIQGAMRTGLLRWDTFRLWLAFTSTVAKARLLVFALGIGAMLVASRIWCRALCPLGALLGLLGKASLFGLSVDRGRCDLCSLCRRVCPTDAMPEEVDCIACFECLPQCPKGAISFRLGWRKVFKAPPRR